MLLNPEVLESPELNLVRFIIIPVIPSDVFDSDKDRKCLDPMPFDCICDGSVPAGRVLDFCVDVDMFSESSLI